MEAVLAFLGITRLVNTVVVVVSLPLLGKLKIKGSLEEMEAKQTVLIRCRRRQFIVGIQLLERQSRKGRINDLHESINVLSSCC